MISERTLKRWRRDALKGLNHVGTLEVSKSGNLTDYSSITNERDQRILRLTQELMDQALLTKGK